MKQKEVYTAYIDGASSGNPGDAGIGIIIYKNKEEILRVSRYIGMQTNNFAEYKAFLSLLEILDKHSIKNIKVFTDSELLVKQLKGEYKINNEAIKKFITEIKKYKKIKYEIEHISREENKEADKLAKQASKRGGKLKDV
ncbi:MAG: ribonuclease HI family protein [Candidatus Goldbacteria bacterium]|nr:ribonuclease HI family protein [Candidatus Goldiibacteriota bacterium]